MKKQIISLATGFLLAVNLLGYIPIESVSAENNSQSTPYISNEVNVEGTNSFGTMLADVLEGEQTEQEANNGHNVFSIEMNGKEADVEFETLTDCTLVVAVYDETGETLVATGSTEVTTEMEETTVNIEVKEMPEYFYLRGFLIEENTFRPLCTAYESNIYTKEMQEFLAKTTDDFDKELVLNLDEDKTNNFAVFSEDTVIVNEGTTKLVSANDTTLTYVFENADAQMKALKKDDVFAFEKTDGEVLIIKVASVATSGTKLTITGQDTELEDVFDYVKIDTEAEDEDISIDTSAPLEEGVTYLGEVDYNSYSSDEYGIQTMAWGGEGTFEKGFEFKIDALKLGNENLSAKLSGKLALKLKNEVKYYLSLDIQYVEFSLEASVKLSVSLSGKLSVDIPLIPIVISPVPGLYIDLTPKFTVEASVSISFSGELKGSIGFRFINLRLYNTSKKPSFDSQISIEGKVFVGLKLEPTVKIISEKVFKTSVGVKTGVELTSKRAIISNSIKHKHACDLCLDGEVKFKIELSFTVKLFNSDKLEFSLTPFTYEGKLFDFYYSATYKELGFGKCPYDLYLVDIHTSKDAQINIIPASGNKDSKKYEAKADKDGNASFYLINGAYTVYATADGKSGSTQFMVNKMPADVQVVLGKIITIPEIGSSGTTHGGSGSTTGVVALGDDRLSLGENYSAYIDDNGDLYMWGANDLGQLGDGTYTGRETPVKIMDNVKSVSLGAHHSAAITTDGSLYMWGHNRSGQLGNGTGGTFTDCSLVPIKIMDNVKSVSLGDSYSAAITTDGSLYMWGSNGCGELGDGATEGRYTPVKIMDNVKSVSLGGTHSAAITTYGSLYMWGDNTWGQLGDGTTEDKLTPVKIMDNVKSVSLGQRHSAAITTDGSLYTWGLGDYGILGNGSSFDQINPVQIMNDVKSVSLGYWHSAAITTDGSLYMWGSNRSGLFGDGSYGGLNNGSYVPIKIINKVKSVCLGYWNSAVIKEDGSLYVWGENNCGQLGDGTTEDKYVPTKVTIPSEASAISLAANEIMPLALNTVYPAFSDLPPNMVYNIYAVQSRNAEEPLCSANLLFISQAVSNENGEIYGNFRPFAETENMEWFCVPMAQTDISGAEVTLPEYEYTGEEQFVKPVVTLDDKVLTEGDDYYLEGDYSFTKPGEYEVTVRGTGLYTGTVSVQYTVGGLVGDVNSDGSLSMRDLTLLQQYLTDWEVEINRYAADLNGDKTVNMRDYALLQQCLNGWEE